MDKIEFDLMQFNNLLNDIGISDILKNTQASEIAINKEKEIWFYVNGIWEKKETNIKTNSIINSLGVSLLSMNNIKSEFNEKNPFLSLTMLDGNRVQLVTSPVVKDTSLTIRVPSTKTFSLQNYFDQGFFDQVKINQGLTEHDLELKALLAKKDFRQFIEKAVIYKKNIIVSGATNSGKTTFLKSLISQLIPLDERIITIEDARETFIPHENSVNMIYPKTQLHNTVTAKACLEACLRMSPDRILLAEVRGDEAFYFVRACGNGHSGSMTSLHADNALMAFEQLALMISASNEGGNIGNIEAIKRFILASIDISINITHNKAKRFINDIYFNPERKNNLLKES